MYGSTIPEEGAIVVEQQQPLMEKQPSLRRRKPRSPGTKKRGSMSKRGQSSRKMLKKKPSGPVLTKIFVQEEEPPPPPPATHGEADEHHHSYVYSMLNPRSNRPQAVVYKHFIAIVILVDLLFFILGTEPDLSTSTKHFFKVSEGVTSTIFLIEYIARLCVCTESRRYARYGPVLGRLRYLVTPAALIDAFATFPFFIERLTGWDLPQLTYLRCFRLLRIMKTQHYAKAFDAVNRVIYYNREILSVALMVCVFLVIFTSVLMYYFRPKHPTDKADFSRYVRGHKIIQICTLTFVITPSLQYFSYNVFEYSHVDGSRWT